MKKKTINENRIPKRLKQLLNGTIKRILTGYVIYYNGLTAIWDITEHLIEEIIQGKITTDPVSVFIHYVDDGLLLFIKTCKYDVIAKYKIGRRNLKLKSIEIKRRNKYRKH